jgi:hypothetical protein
VAVAYIGSQRVDLVETAGVAEVVAAAAGVAWVAAAVSMAAAQMVDGK